MTRDEILAEVERLSTVPAAPAPYPSLDQIVTRMRAVVATAQEYPDHADGEALAEELEHAVARFADMVEAYTP